MWWVPAGHRPTIAEAIERLEHLKTTRPERARVRLGERRLRATLEDGEVRMSTFTLNPLWRTLTLLARLDIAASLAIAAALLIWMALH